MYVELDQRPVADAAEAVDLPGFDHEDVAGTSLELLSVDGPETAPFPHELDFVVRMAMRPRPTPGQGAEKEDGDVHVAVVGTHELVGAALKWQVLLTDTVHSGTLGGRLVSMALRTPKIGGGFRTEEPMTVMARGREVI
jgi:hypothetical protein